VVDCGTICNHRGFSDGAIRRGCASAADPPLLAVLGRQHEPQIFRIASRRTSFQAQLRLWLSPMPLIRQPSGAFSIPSRPISPERKRWSVLETRYSYRELQRETDYFLAARCSTGPAARRARRHRSHSCAEWLLLQQCRQSADWSAY
jgi:hypothetical protein